MVIPLKTTGVRSRNFSKRVSTWLHNRSTSRFGAKRGDYHLLDIQQRARPLKIG